MGADRRLDGHVAQAVFTVVTRVRRERVPALRDALAAIAADPAANPVLPLAALPGLHYATLVLHAQEPGRPLLVFEANVDGTAAALLEHVVDTAGEGVADVWSHCAGFPDHGGRRERIRYLRDHVVLPAAYHVGTTGRSRDRIVAEAELRRAVAAFVDDQRRAGTLPATSRDVRDAVVDHVGAHPDLAWALAPPPREPAADRLRRGWFLARSSDRRALLPAGVSAAVAVRAARRGPRRALLRTSGVAVALAAALRLLEHREEALAPPVPDDLLDAIEAVENRPGVVTNHLASLVDLKPRRLLLARTILLVIDVAARVRYTKGRLGSIPSIHFAHWSVIDGGRRLLFVSNYDGSWESYLDDFIEKAASGLSAVWSNTEDFPPARWLGILPGTGGARRGPEFKRMARNSQSPTTIRYCAYPELTVTNIQDNTALRRGLVGPMDEEAAWTWLSRL